jgi:hypothetical protein
MGRERAVARGNCAWSVWPTSVISGVLLPQPSTCVWCGGVHRRNVGVDNAAGMAGVFVCGVRQRRSPADAAASKGW